MPEYKNPVPVAVCIVPVRFGGEVKLVGIVRNIEPAKGGMALPGGYVDHLESAQAAAAREMEEETTFQSNASDWAVVDSATNDANRMLLFCVHNRVLSSAEFERLQPGDPREVAEVVLLDRATAQDAGKVPFSLHRSFMAKFFSGLVD